MPPNRFESEVESFLEGSHGDRTHIKRADHPRLHHYAGRYSVGARKPATRLSDTGVAFVRAGRASTETGIAFARPCRASSETAIAFARVYVRRIETPVAFP